MECSVPKVAQDQKWRWERVTLDMSEKENIELDRKEEPMDYSTGLPSDWRYEGANLANSFVSLVAMGDSVNVSRGVLNGTSSCSSASMVDSFGPNFWYPSTTNSQNLGFSGINVHNNGSSSNAFGIRKDGFRFGRSVHDHDHGTLEMGWNSANFMLKGDGFLPNGPVIPPQSICHFATDSGFIERPARFSCFSGVNFGDMVNAYGIPQSIGLYDGNGGAMHGTRDTVSGHVLQSSVPGGQSEESNLNVAEASKDASPSVEHLLATRPSPLNNDKRSESLVWPTNESERAESSDDGDDRGDDGDDSPMLESTTGEQGRNTKKRKRIGKGASSDKGNVASELPSEGAKDNTHSQQKGDRQPISTTKASGKNAKQGSQASDPNKEEYIHVRARRGQATNSHSLAERVRREKISERMKFLQDLVPGCSKVTGKAVMLDEIINYVQSLQRQVEFLSMKLATVNPRLDFNIEGLLPKDVLHRRPVPSSAMGFPLEMSMAFPTLNQSSQQGLIQSTFPIMANTSDILRRTIHPPLASLSGGFKEPNQMPDVWDDELHNVVHMNFTPSALLSSQEVDGTVASSQMKVEL